MDDLSETGRTQSVSDSSRHPALRDRETCAVALGAARGQHGILVQGRICDRMKTTLYRIVTLALLVLALGVLLDVRAKVLYPVCAECGESLTIESDGGK